MGVSTTHETNKLQCHHMPSPRLFIAFAGIGVAANAVDNMRNLEQVSQSIHLCSLGHRCLTRATERRTHAHTHIGLMSGVSIVPPLCTLGFLSIP